MPVGLYLRVCRFFLRHGCISDVMEQRLANQIRIEPLAQIRRESPAHAQSVLIADWNVLYLVVPCEFLAEMCAQVSHSFAQLLWDAISTFYLK